MAIAGALIGSFGRKPNIPQLPAINPSAVQQETIAGNVDALPGLQSLAGKVNAFNIDQELAATRRALEFAAPGQLEQVQKITDAQLRGEIPQDVQEATLRSGAARALASGAGGGSSFARNLTLRDLGLTSLGIQQQGVSNFGFLSSLAPRTPLFDITSMFFTPQQRLEFAFQDRNAKFQRDLLAEQVEAAPDPATAALGREVDRFFNTAAQVGTMSAGKI